MMRLGREETRQSDTVLVGHTQSPGPLIFLRKVLNGVSIDDLSGRCLQLTNDDNHLCIVLYTLDS